MRPKCGNSKGKLTKHHVFPQLHYGRNNQLGECYLCRSCHDELERMIPHEKMPDSFYPKVLATFMKGECLSKDSYSRGRNYRPKKKRVMYRFLRRLRNRPHITCYIPNYA